MIDTTQHSNDRGDIPEMPPATDETIASDDGVAGETVGAAAEPPKGAIIGRYVTLRLGTGTPGVAGKTFSSPIGESRSCGR